MPQRDHRAKSGQRVNCLRQRRPGTQVTADESLRGDSGRKVSPVFLVAVSRSYEGRPFSNGRKIQDLTSRNRVISSDYRSGPRSGRREKAERPRPALSEGIQIGRGREVHTWQRAPEAVARQPPREWDGRPQAGRSHVPARLAGSRPTSERLNDRPAQTPRQRRAAERHYRASEECPLAEARSRPSTAS